MAHSQIYGTVCTKSFQCLGSVKALGEQGVDHEIPASFWDISSSSFFSFCESESLYFVPRFLLVSFIESLHSCFFPSCGTVMYSHANFMDCV